MSLEFLDAISPVDGLTKKQRYNHSAAGKDARARYRHDKSKHRTDADYLSTPFVGWDGEGTDMPDGSQAYSLLMKHTDNGPTDYIEDAKGLGTERILDFLLDSNDPKAINVIYGGSYDANMWLRSLDPETLEGVYRNKYQDWQGAWGRYRIMWRPGKSFYVRRLDESGKPTGKGVTIYDTISFFQCSFVKAMDAYLGTNWPGRDFVIAQKANRGTFTTEDAETVREYCEQEIINLVNLLNELRLRLNRVTLRPRRWDGPGAIAASLLLRENVKDHMAVSPLPVARAARFAYAGGRFEVFKFGHTNETCYEYDVNSAYPAALVNVPSLANGEWIHVTGDDAKKVHPFALYHISWDVFNEDHAMCLPGPLFIRMPKGSICYPFEGEGWYWSPELESTMLWEQKGYGTFTVSEAWYFQESTDVKPFAFIEGLFNKRQALKKAGDGAQVGIKLGLNSLYGKLAQQVGWEIHKGTLRTPPFHQLEWAGYATSFCRARVMTAALEDLSSVIAFETDALFSTHPLNVPLSNRLGEFDCVEFDTLTYAQSGIYFGGVDGSMTTKTRGINLGNLDRQTVLTTWHKHWEERLIPVTVRRFIGIGQALQFTDGMERWCGWEDFTKEIKIEPTGKRQHREWPFGECRACRGLPPSAGITLYKWHDTACIYSVGGRMHSHEFPIEWMVGKEDESMTQELGALRMQPHDWEWTE